MGEGRPRSIDSRGQGSAAASGPRVTLREERAVSRLRVREGCGREKLKGSVAASGLHAWSGAACVPASRHHLHARDVEGSVAASGLPTRDAGCEGEYWRSCRRSLAWMGRRREKN